METVTKIDPNLKGKELFDFAVANKSTLIAQKKYAPKFGDAFCFTKNVETAHGTTVKANVPVMKEAGQPSGNIEVLTVINTCNWFDSHWDVHIPGIWKKSLGDNKNLYLLQEHKMSFSGIITEDVEAYTQRMSWKSLSVDVDGYTEALVFKNIIPEKRNSYMYNQYKDGYVRNHSVGMRYVKIELAINDEDYKEEFAVWNKYIDQIANKDEAIAIGMFWAVKEAQVVEGSAVPIGSNIITPTLEVNESTDEQPPVGTVNQPQKNGGFNSIEAIKRHKFIN